MAINMVPNTTGSASGLSSSGGSPQTQVSVKASDVFALKDPVFMDWKTGEYVNLNSMVAGPALTAGPALSTLTAAESVYMAAGSASSNGMRLPDGSMVAIVAAMDSNTYTAMISLHKYNAKGVLTGKLLLQTLGSAGSAIPVPTGLCIALLESGNYAVTFSVNNNAATQWAVISPALQLLYTGTTKVQAAAAFHIQPIANGGFLVSHGRGVDLVSAAGVANSVLTLDTSGYGQLTRDDLNCDGLKSDDSASQSLTNYQPFALPGGGYGYFFSGATNCTYYKVSAIGALVTSVILQSWAAQAFYGGRAAISPATGNIAWVCNSFNSNGSYYGVIAQDGTVLKASSAAGIKQYSTSMRLVADAAGGFVLCTWDGANWNVRCMSATGVDAASFPKVLLAGTSITMAENTNIISLSTGTLFIAGIGPDPYCVSYAWITTAGVITTGVIYNFKNAGNSAMTINATVLNDKVYGFCTVGTAQSGSVADVVMFSVSNTGEAVRAPQVLGTVVYYGALRMALDYSGKYMHVAFGLGGVAGSNSMVATFDPSNLSMVQTYTFPFPIYTSRMRSLAQGLFFFDHAFNQNPSFAKTIPPTVAVFVKPKSTVLIGVAAAPAAKGDQLIVDTKGLFSLSDAWKSAAQTFDQSANSPPGNAGSINNSLINLKGF